MKQKKGVSGVVTAVILIALVIAAVATVWVVVNNLIKGNINSAEACFGIFDKVTINNLYTCHDASANELQFSINIADLDVEKVIVSLSGNGATKSYELTKSGLSDNTLRPYGNSSYGEIVYLPGKNAGLTYVADLSGLGFNSPDLIEISPVINDQQCKTSDSLSNFDDCQLLV